ncbi:MAG: DUF1648 domain-containing protein, partial [Clostridiales bacterium]
MRNTETENKLDHLKLSFTKPEIAMEIAATFALIAAIVVVALYYQQLPDQIPTHFGFNGEVDGYGGKNSIFLFLGIQIFVYLLLTISLFFPRFYNMPVEITVENAEK